MNRIKRNFDLYVFILFLQIGCSISKLLIQKSSKSLLQVKQQPDVHNLVIFGNIGEIEYFRDATVSSEKLREDQKENYYKNNVFSQKYFTNNLSCSVKDTTSNTPIDLLNEKGLTNFKTVLFDKNVLEFVRRSNEVLFLGEIVDPEYSQLALIRKGKQNSDNSDFFESRIRCGWNIFLNALKNANLLKITTKEDKEEIAISGKIKFSKGRNSQLIRRDFEQEIMSNFTTFNDEHSGSNAETKSEGLLNSEITNLNTSTNNGFNNFPLGKTPIITTVVYDEFTLQIIDFDSNILRCLFNDTEAGYINCTKDKYVSKYSFKEASKYALALDKILNEKVLKSDSNKKIWKIMRANHSPLYSTSKSNLFYFKNLTALNSNGEPVIFNLWKSIKRNLINIFFSAKVRSASVSIIPYSIKDFENTNFDCLKQKYKDSGCYVHLDKDETNQIDYKKLPTIKNNCYNNIFYRLPYKENTDKAEESLMYVFNVGNSGMNLENMEFGNIANAYLIWKRSQKDYYSSKFIYGFSHVSFRKDFVEVDFLETQVNKEDKSTKTYKAATFRISTDSPIPDQTKLNHYIKNNICKDYLVIGRSGTI